MRVGFTLLLFLGIVHGASAQSSDIQVLIAFVQKLTNPSSNWASQNPCSWNGVFCTAGNRVRGLNMSNAQLNGTISPTIAGLSHLNYLNLSNNKLTGNIPVGLTFVSELKILDLGTNFLSGIIPPICTSYYSKLTELYLNDNQLSGKLGSSLANCQQLLVVSLANNQLEDQNLLINLTNLPTLRTVSLSGNTINAAIPPLIKTWKNMRSLLLDGCSLTGYLRKEFASLRNMETLNVKNNRLIGRLPEELFNCISLKNLYLDGNKFTGPIPSLIGNLSDLQTFYGNDNGFTDDIPESIFSLLQMRDLNLCNNTFGGTLSRKIGDLKHLYALDLSQNLITGQIPEEVSGCESLSWLDLSSNRLSDTIPSSIGNLTLLNYLNLSHNQLTGQIPSSLTNLPSMQLFDVSYNQLVGLVPDTDVFREFPLSSFEYNKGLCGWITNQSGQQCLARSSRVAFYEHFSSHIAIIVVIVVFLLVGIGAWQCIVRWSPLQPIITRPQMTFTVRQLFDATEGFSQNNFLGEGVHYKVFKGSLVGNKEVAVKQLKQEYVEEFRKAFIVDWRTLAKAKHLHLIDVLGWCASKDMFAVVTAFMSNGTLDQHLHGKDAAISMPWARRVQIAKGVADGLAFLHRDWQADPLLRMYIWCHVDCKCRSVQLWHSFVGAAYKKEACRFFSLVWFKYSRSFVSVLSCMGDGGSNFACSKSS